MFIGSSHKIDGCIIAVIFLGQAKSELIVNKKSIVTCSFERISLVSIFHLTQLALVPLDALGGAEALARVGVTERGMPIALAWLTSSPIGGITIEARYAGLAVLACGQVLTLLTDTLINAFAVAIALASWTMNERPVVSAVLQAHAGIEKGLWVGISCRGLRRHLHWSFIRALYAFPFASIAGIGAPAAAWLLQAMAAGTVARTIFRGAAAHGVPLHTLAKREGGHIGIGVHTLLHVAAPHALRAATGALATRCPQGTRRPALLGAVVRRPFTDTTIEWVDAGCSLQAPSTGF